MKKKINIGLFGAVINNDNMGCCALTYSLIRTLEKISKDEDVEFNYIIFERWPDSKRIQILQNDLNLQKNQVRSGKSIRFSKIYHVKELRKYKQLIRKCDFAIDITQGDSFTDIYGIKRFLAFSLDKKLVQTYGVPLILGPQTYGPFNKELSRIVSKNIINKAFAVISRDKYSTDYLKKIGIKQKVITATDLAFGLPYEKVINDKKEKNIGLNLSGLLWPDKIEDTETKFKLECDYKKLSLELVKLFQNKGYTVHLISHVGADYGVCKMLHEQYPDTVLVKEFMSPIGIKNYIAKMDIFVGARMHATIAALSTGVPVIPIAYSRKFKGLFNNLDYPVCVDLQTLNTERAFEKIKEYLENYDELLKYTNISKQKADIEYSKLCLEMRKIISKIIKK